MLTQEKRRSALVALGDWRELRKRAHVESSQRHDALRQADTAKTSRKQPRQSLKAVSGCAVHGPQTGGKLFLAALLGSCDEVTAPQLVACQLQ